MNIGSYGGPLVITIVVDFLTGLLVPQTPLEPDRGSLGSLTRLVKLAGNRLTAEVPCDRLPTPE